MDSRCVQNLAVADFSDGIYAAEQGWQARMNDALKEWLRILKNVNIFFYVLKIKICMKR